MTTATYITLARILLIPVFVGFAIYYAPDSDSLLHTLSSQWLGRDAFTGSALAQPAIGGIAELTADARRYGFHATLKPPFAMRSELSHEALILAVKDVALAFKPFQIKLEACFIDGFLALVPATTSRSLAALAAACVRELDRFRLPHCDAEIMKRRAASLSTRQEDHLLRWGYPFVFEDFRFHMTLSHRLAAADADRLLPAAESHFAPILSRPVTIAALTLFREPEIGDPFQVIRQFPFTSQLPEAVL